MPIYGLNFSGVPLPQGHGHALTRRVKELIPITNFDGSPSMSLPAMLPYTLQGMCDTPEELDSMITQASNGTRKLHIETKKNRFLIYVR